MLFEAGPGQARALAREHLHGHLQTPYNIAKFRRLGHTDDDLSGGSDRFVGTGRIGAAAVAVARQGAAGVEDPLEASANR
ncbi:hypothetical protein ACWDBD_26530 [Streptomyces sp. NPDC001118]